MSKDSAAIRDQLGKDPDVFQVLNANYTETYGIEEQSTLINTQNRNNTWTVGSATNAIVGTWTGTTGGGQLQVGSTSSDNTLVRVVNPNRIYHEHFRTEEFKDTSAPNTADWNTTNFNIAMSSSSNHATLYNTVATSNRIALNDGTVNRVLISSTETKWNSNDIIKYEVKTSAAGAWQEITKDEITTVTTAGTELYFRIIFIGNGGSSTYIEDLDINYS